MAEAEERPAKIRKLNFSEVDESNDQFMRGKSMQSGVPDEIGIAGQTEEDEEDDEDHLDAKEDDDTPTPAESSSIPNPQNATEPPKTLSKNQLKKLRKKAEWEAGREHRKALKKEKAKAKKLRRKEGLASTMHDSLPKPKNLPNMEPSPPQVRKRALQTPITFVIDCSFDDLMTDKERTSLGSQLTRSYSDNKTAPFKGHVVISSWGGKLKERFETVLANTHLSWKDVRFMEEDFVEAARKMHSVMHGKEGGKVAGALAETKMDEAQVPITEEVPQENEENENIMAEPANVVSEEANGDSENSLEEQRIPQTSQQNQPSQPSIEPASDQESEPQVPSSEPSIIYLTSDSPHTLTTLSPYTNYIIGGLVDKNRHKGICYKRACERGIPTAKLPIGEYMIMQSRTVLATNHVVEIMVRYLEDGDWGKAFLRVIPKRKEAKLKGKGEGEKKLVNGDDADGQGEEQGEEQVEAPGKADMGDDAEDGFDDNGEDHHEISKEEAQEPQEAA